MKYKKNEYIYSTAGVLVFARHSEHLVTTHIPSLLQKLKLRK